MLLKYDEKEMMLQILNKITSENITYTSLSKDLFTEQDKQHQFEMLRQRLVESEDFMSSLSCVNLLAVNTLNRIASFCNLYFNIGYNQNKNDLIINEMISKNYISIARYTTVKTKKHKLSLETKLLLKNLRKNSNIENFLKINVYEAIDHTTENYKIDNVFSKTIADLINKEIENLFTHFPKQYNLALAACKIFEKIYKKANSSFLEHFQIRKYYSLKEVIEILEENEEIIKLTTDSEIKVEIHSLRELYKKYQKLE